MGKGKDGCEHTPLLMHASQSAVNMANSLIQSNPLLPQERADALSMELEQRLAMPIFQDCNPLFVVVGGSFAYGLAHADSDLDLRGTYLAPSREFLGLAQVSEQTEDKLNDTVLFEVGKLAKLAAKGNPNILETLWTTPLATSSAGETFLAGRELFLSQRIRDSIAGFAYGQMKRIKQNPEQREKAVRHMLRLMEMGEHALRTGQLKVRVDDPERIIAQGKMPLEQVEALFAKLDHRIQTMPSVLPQYPDMDAINSLILELRLQELADSERG